MATTSDLFRRGRLWGALLALALLLSACGFHLRGQGGSYLLPFPTMYVGLPDGSPLAVELKRNIRANGGTTVVNKAAGADGIIEVLTDPEKTRSKSILSLDKNGRVREYLLSYNIVFRVIDSQNNELLAPTRITLTRPITFNETQLLAKEQEEAQLYKDMRTDLVQQMMRRLAALKPKVTMSVAPATPVKAPVDAAPADGKQ
ncbi:LPS assembly lipoprotein LptE [Oxalobacteraceae bacterium A2-2]